jgi:hypothetical protein
MLLAHRSNRSTDWLKIKNPDSPAMIGARETGNAVAKSTSLWQGLSSEGLELLSRLVLIAAGLRFALAKKEFDEDSCGLRDFL